MSWRETNIRRNKKFVYYLNIKMIFHRLIPDINLHILIYHTLIYSLSSNLKYYLNAINFLQLSVSAICSQFHWKTSKSNELQLKRLVYSCIMHDCKIFRVYEKMKTGLPLIVCTKRTLSNSCAHFLYWSVLFIQLKTR